MDNVTDLAVVFGALVALVFYSFAVWGLCWTIAGSKISMPFRRLLEYLSEPASRVRVPCSFLLSLIECPACVSFHVGWISVLVLARDYLAGWTLAAVALAVGFYNIGVIYTIGRLTGFIEEA